MKTVTNGGVLLQIVMKYILSGVLILSFFISATAQNDSLVSKSYTDLTELSKQKRQTDTVFSLAVWDAYVKKARLENDAENEFEGLSNYINYLIWYRKFEDIKSKETELTAVAKANTFDSLLMKSYFTRGNSYFYSGLWGRSIDSYSSSLEIAKKLDRLDYIIQNVTQIGYMRSFSGEFNSAIVQQKEALELLETTRAKATLTTEKYEQYKFIGLSRISFSYYVNKEYEEAKHYIDKAITLRNKSHDTCYDHSAYTTKAGIEIELENFEDARESLKLSLKKCTPLFPIDSLIIYANYGRYYLKNKEYDKAVSYLQKSLDTYHVKEEEEGFMLDLYKNLAFAYKFKGDITKSNYYLEKYIYTQDQFIKIQDTVMRSFRKREIADFRNELNTIEAEKNKQVNYLYYLFLGASVIILGLLFFLLRFYREKKKNEDKFEALLSKINAAERPKNIINTKDEVLEEKTTNDIPEETKQQILDGLQKLEEKEYFLKQECNSYNVAKKINTNTSYLSKVINAHYGKNFNTYINDLRINYAIVRLKDDVIFRSYSIQSIAEELGYKSADSFTKYFKKDTGLNPSFYIKEIKNIT